MSETKMAKFRCTKRETKPSQVEFGVRAKGPCHQRRPIMKCAVALHQDRINGFSREIGLLIIACFGGLSVQPPTAHGARATRRPTRGCLKTTNWVRGSDLLGTLNHRRRPLIGVLSAPQRMIPKLIDLETDKYMTRPPSEELIAPTTCRRRSQRQRLLFFTRSVAYVVGIHSKDASFGNDLPPRSSLLSSSNCSR